MNVEIRKLTPVLVEDYVQFFDTTPHDDNTDASKCYCVCWSNVSDEGKDFSTAAKRRNIAIEYVKGGNIQGYLAYCDDKAVGWCNANTKSDCYECVSWKRFMREIDREEASPNLKVKSVYCFVIAPEMRGKGIAGLLLERVCADAKQEGFAFVEAYPNKTFIDEARDFMGPAKLYEKFGFVLCYEAGQKLVMRKKLSSLDSCSPS